MVSLIVKLKRLCLAFICDKSKFSVKRNQNPTIVSSICPFNFVYFVILEGKTAVSIKILSFKRRGG